MARERIRKKHRWWRAIGVLLAGVFVAVTGLYFYVSTNFETEADASLFGMTIADSTTRFYYCDTGTDHTYDASKIVELDETLKGTRHMLYCDYEDMPKKLIEAFVAIEDKRFFEHEGVDLYRSAAAAANYLLGFDDRFGASTITQQLVKNVTGNNEVTVKRKIQEMLYAYDLEKKLYI